MARPNLIDQAPIDAYLNGFLPSDPQAAGLLKLALAKVLAKRPENFREMTELPEDAPQWLKAKWPSGGPYHRFSPDSGLDHQVRHVADWIKAALLDNDAWLDHTDDKGRPHKLLKLGSLEQACAEADKAMRLRNQRLASQLAPIAEGEETVMMMTDGFHIVRLRTASALDREGVAMGHCIGQGSYDQSLADGTKQFFSLRDGAGKPHATLEVDSAKRTLLQCQGKGNQPPVAKYHPYLQTFLKKERLRLEVPARNTGLIESGGEYYSIYDLPENLYVKEDLDLSGTSITSLPAGLTVRGDLYLSHTRIASLPAGLKVANSLCLRGTSVTDLPDGLNVGGYLDLSDTRIVSLPDGLEISSLYLCGTPITTLPNGLKVQGNLDLSGTSITSLPVGLKVGGSLDLSHTPITTLPADLKVRGALDLSHTRIASLPAGLKVGGYLNLSHTSIASLPAGLKVGGYLNLSHTSIASLPARLKVGDYLDLRGTGITSLPADAIVRGRVAIDPLSAAPQRPRPGGLPPARPARVAGPAAAGLPDRFGRMPAEAELPLDVQLPPRSSAGHHAARLAGKVQADAPFAAKVTTRTDGGHGTER